MFIYEINSKCNQIIIQNDFLHKEIDNIDQLIIYIDKNKYSIISLLNKYRGNFVILQNC